MPENTNNAGGTSSMMTVDDLKKRKFGIALSLLGGVGITMWAATKGKKGKFWWFVGGYIAGGAVGTILDYATNK